MFNHAKLRKAKQCPGKVHDAGFCFWEGDTLRKRQCLKRTHILYHRSYTAVLGFRERVRYTSKRARGRAFGDGFFSLLCTRTMINHFDGHSTTTRGDLMVGTRLSPIHIRFFSIFDDGKEMISTMSKRSSIAFFPSFVASSVSELPRKNEKFGGKIEFATNFYQNSVFSVFLPI